MEEFFLEPARRLPQRRFLLGGSGWGDKELPANVDYLGHVYTADHNAFNCTPRAVLNISRESMARYGFSPATRVFEAAGAGACLVTDEWEGIENFFEPGKELLVARDGEAVAALLEGLTPPRAREIGQAAYRRAKAEHTYRHRAASVEAALEGGARAGMKIVILGLSITSSWGNGHATTYRALVRELCARGHEILFLERDQPWYAANRDLPSPPYGRTELYRSMTELRDRFSDEVGSADAVIVGSYVPEGSLSAGG